MSAVAKVLRSATSSDFGLGSLCNSRVLSASAIQQHPQETLLFPAEVYSLAKPQSVQQVVSEVDSDAHIYTNPVSLVDVEHARVYFSGPQCLVRAPSGEVVVQYNIGEDQAESVTSKRCRRLHGTTMLLGASPGANCFYHWMMDIIPKLGMLQKAGISLDSIDHFLIRNANNAFQLETLARLGIHQDRLVLTQKKHHWHCDRLLHVNMVNGINMKMNRFIPTWLKHVFAETADEVEPIKLYVSRPEGVRRGITNEIELKPILEEFGYQVMPMEGLSFAEQVSLMRNVRVLVSAHGGALSNMVFCRPGIRVGEIFGHHVFPYYYGLSQLCGHDYHVLIKDEQLYPQAVQFHSALMAGSHEAQLKTVTADFTVDTAKFRAMLELLDT